MVRAEESREYAVRDPDVRIITATRHLTERMTAETATRITIVEAPQALLTAPREVTTAAIAPRARWAVAHEAPMEEAVAAGTIAVAEDKRIEKMTQ